MDAEDPTWWIDDPEGNHICESNFRRKIQVFHLVLCDYKSHRYRSPDASTSRRNNLLKVLIQSFLGMTMRNLKTWHLVHLYLGGIDRRKFKW